MNEIDRRDPVEDSGEESKKYKNYREWWNEQAEDLGERWHRPGNRLDDDWSVPEGVRNSPIDRDAYGPNFAGGGYDPNSYVLRGAAFEAVWNKLTTGDVAMLALVAKTPIQELHKLHPMLAEWKFLTEDHGFVSVNDGNYDLTDDGKRFVSQLDHLADHLPLHVLISGGIGTLIGALITAWNTYETYKLGENLTLEEWGCVTYDFITDNVNQVSEQAEDALDALGAIVRSINEEIDNLTNNGVATAIVTGKHYQ
jgi:hypothetical protein